MGNLLLCICILFVAALHFQDQRRWMCVVVMLAIAVVQMALVF